MAVQVQIKIDTDFDNSDEWNGWMDTVPQLGWTGEIRGPSGYLSAYFKVTGVHMALDVDGRVSPSYVVIAESTEAS